MYVPLFVRNINILLNSHQRYCLERFCNGIEKCGFFPPKLIPNRNQINKFKVSLNSSTCILSTIKYAEWCLYVLFSCYYLDINVKDFQGKIYTKCKISQGCFKTISKTKHMAICFLTKSQKLTHETFFSVTDCCVNVRP